LFVCLNLFNDTISNLDYVASNWIIVNTELEMIWKNMSLIESAVFAVSWVGQGKHEKLRSLHSKP